MSYQIIGLVAQTATTLNISPFLPRNVATWKGTAGDIAYGVNLPGRDASASPYQRFVGNGSKVQWTQAEVAELANVPVVGDFTDANALSTVIMQGGSLLQRVAHPAVPVAGEFTLVAGTVASATVTFADVPADAGTLTIDDGTNTPTVFEFDTAGDGVAGANVVVDTSAAADGADVGVVFAAAVNAVAGTLTVTAVDNLDGTVTLLSDLGGIIADLGATTDATNTTIVDFAGGADSGVTLTLGAAPAIDVVVELFNTAVADLQTITIPAGGIIEGGAPQVVRTDASAAITVKRLTR